MIVIENNQVYSTTGKFVHRIGTNSYFKRCTILKSDSVDSFEEVDEIPNTDDSQYKEKVIEAVHEKYSLDDENAIMRKEIARLGNTSEEFNAYNAYVEACKNECKSKIEKEQ